MGYGKRVGKEGGCDRCGEPAYEGPEICDVCGKAYRRCIEHGGTQGARRSIHSHKALHHPKGGF